MPAVLPPSSRRSREGGGGGCSFFFVCVFLLISTTHQRLSPDINVNHIHFVINNGVKVQVQNHLREKKAHQHDCLKSSHYGRGEGRRSFQERVTGPNAWLWSCGAVTEPLLRFFSTGGSRRRQESQQNTLKKENFISTAHKYS